jgi:hypothetical protein
MIFLIDPATVAAIGDCKAFCGPVFKPLYGVPGPVPV